MSTQWAFVLGALAGMAFLRVWQAMANKPAEAWPTTGRKCACTHADYAHRPEDQYHGCGVVLVRAGGEAYACGCRKFTPAPQGDTDLERLRRMAGLESKAGA